MQDICQMKIGLIDVDNWTKLDKCFPNLPLMKLSAYYKQKGDTVEWYKQEEQYDVVYLSKVFSFTPDFSEEIHADRIIKGGSGYAITLKDGKEHFDKDKHQNLPDQIEHIFPDYSLYGITETAYGFMSRGCPRGCFFCHVKDKEGRCSYKVADLKEFWNGQKKIELLDPNTFACPDWKDILQQLIDSGSWVNFNQGVDIRMMTDQKCDMLMQVKVRQVHFAWDRYEDKELIVPKLKEFQKRTGWNRAKVSVYILTNYDTTMEQNLERIMFVRSLGFQPYVMRYDKEHLPRGHILNSLARWTNNKLIFWKCPTFDQYLEDRKHGLWV